MQLFDEKPFDYLPGESVLVPSNVEMVIDFPEATTNNPTQCLALAIDHRKIEETLVLLNEKYPKSDQKNYWQLDEYDYFFYNNEELAATMNKLIQVCLSTSITKDLIADLTLQELLIYLIQSQTVNSIDSGRVFETNTVLAHVVTYIRENLSTKISMESLTDAACMSQASFYRFFRRELGMSPIEFITRERVRYAKMLLKDVRLQISQVCYEAGFQDSNYFVRVFKKLEGITPSQYRQCLSNDEIILL